MARRPRRDHASAFKPKVALAAVRGEQTLGELVQQFVVHSNQTKPWRDQLMESVMGVDNVAEVSAEIGGYLTFHNTKRPNHTRYDFGWF